jgi:hypothetical protein
LPRFAKHYTEVGGKMPRNAIRNHSFANISGYGHVKKLEIDAFESAYFQLSSNQLFTAFPRLLHHRHKIKAAPQPKSR